MPSELSERFDAAIAVAGALPRRPDGPTLLKLYRLYKQATVGDAPERAPAPTGAALRRRPFLLSRWRAWADVRGLGRDEAMQRYVELVERLR